MSFKKHEYFPPSLKTVCGFWGSVTGIVLAAWGVSYFTKWELPFLYILLIIAGLFILNLIYNYHLEYKSFQDLLDRYNVLKNESDTAKSIKVTDKERGIELEVNGEQIKDPDLREIVHITLERYKHSNEEERKKWIQKGKDERDYYLEHHAW